MILLISDETEAISLEVKAEYEALVNKVGKEDIKKNLFGATTTKEKISPYS